MAHTPSGGLDEVRDVVQDAWFRLGRADRWEIGRVAVRPVVPISPLAPETPRTAQGAQNRHHAYGS
jgi:RNA polymerase sigma-70 factor, ECF subfamily